MGGKPSASFCDVDFWQRKGQRYKSMKEKMRKLRRNLQEQVRALIKRGENEVAMNEMLQRAEAAGLKKNYSSTIKNEVRFGIPLLFFKYN